MSITSGRLTHNVIPAQAGIQLEIKPPPPGGSGEISGWAPAFAGVTPRVGRDRAQPQLILMLSFLIVSPSNDEARG
jgi:hypothetical protein